MSVVVSFMERRAAQMGLTPAQYTLLGRIVANSAPPWKTRVKFADLSPAEQTDLRELTFRGMVTVNIRSRDWELTATKLGVQTHPVGT